MDIPTLDEFIKQEYDKLPKEEKPSGMIDNMEFFVKTEELYKQRYPQIIESTDRDA